MPISQERKLFDVTFINLYCWHFPVQHDSFKIQHGNKCHVLNHGLLDIGNYLKKQKVSVIFGITTFEFSFIYNKGFQ